MFNSFYYGMVWLFWKNSFLTLFYFCRVWWSWKNWFLTVSILVGCGGLERTDFKQFLLWEGVVVLKELISNSFNSGRVWWSWKNDFNTFYFKRMWWSWNELIFNTFFFKRVWWSWKSSFLIVPTLRGWFCLEITDV